MTPEAYQRQVVGEMKDHIRRALAAQCQQLAAFEAVEVRRFVLGVPAYSREETRCNQEQAAEAYRLARQIAGVEL